MAGGYRVAPERVLEEIVCRPLVAWRGVVYGVHALGAGAVIYFAAGLSGVALWGASIVCALILFRAALRGGPRVRLRVDPRGRHVVVETRRGVRKHREEHDLTGARKVGIELQGSSHWLAHLPARPLVEACIVVEDEDGTVRRLFEPRFGRRAQARAANALARRLHLEQRPTPATSPPASLNPNARIYVMVVMAIVAVGALGAGTQIYEVRDQGRLEIRCTSTCRIDGMTCLPGGMLGMSLPPGKRIIEVASESAPGGFREVTLPIRIGHRTTFECLPDAVSPEPVPET